MEKLEKRLNWEDKPGQVYLDSLIYHNFKSKTEGFCQFYPVSYLKGFYFDKENWKI